MDCPFYCAFGQVSSQATDYLPANVPIVTIYKSQMFFLKYLTCPKKNFFHLVRYFVLKVTKCQSCNKELEFLRTHKKCVNLGCTEYNKKLRRYDVSQSKKEDEK